MNNIESNFLLLATGAYFVSMILYFFFIPFKKEIIAKSAKILLASGLILHSISIGARIFSSGRLPFSNLYESMTCFVWGIVLAGLIIEFIFDMKILEVVVVPVAFLAALYASTLNKTIEPLVPALQSNWLLAHVGVAIIAYGVFTISFGTALLYIIKDKFNIELLPAKEKLDDLTYKLIAFAFPFMTLVLITGAVWAEQAWGTYWSWDPKETWSLITLLIYTSYLHARLVLKWNGKISAWLAIIGFLAVIFTYLGVSFLLSGLHSYAK